MARTSLVILTGAGISAESGIKTFRDHNGLWENHRLEDVASIDGFIRNPALVQQFYNARRAQLGDQGVVPNLAHLALARLEREWPGELLLVTQNVDNLHERAGSSGVVHMHGELAKARCTKSLRSFDWLGPIEKDSSCRCCGARGTLRPDIVWFGEMPMHMELITRALETCTTFVAIGTSGQVYPAAGFVHQLPMKARKIEINADSSAISSSFTELWRGPASVEVPRFVDEILKDVSESG